MIIYFVYRYGMNYRSFHLNVEPSTKIIDLILNNKSSFKYISAIHANYAILGIDIYKTYDLSKQKFSFLFYKGKILENDRTIKYYNIEDYDTINFEIDNNAVGAGIWDGIKNDIDLKIGFDVNLAKREELKINLIHFDLNMTNSENYEYYNNFKVDVVGGFYAVDDLNILKNYLDKIKEKNIHFILITSGSSAKKVIPICQKYPFIKEIIIFCFNYSKHKHFIDDYPGYVNHVFTDIISVYKYLKSYTDLEYEVYKINYQKKSFFSQEEIKMEKQYLQCPVISATEYDKCFFLVHRAYSHFFHKINDNKEKPMFRADNYTKILEALYDINKKNLLEKFKKLVNLDDNNTFVEESLRVYTSENDFCYLFNSIMRNFETGIIKFAYYMGPLLYGLNKYVLENPSFAILKDMKLFRIIEISELDFYLYKLNIGHIICFPALTSTSSKEINFEPTDLAKKISNKNKEHLTKIKLIFNYKYKKGNISPGIIIEDKKDSKGEYISKCPLENEVLLFLLLL